MRKRAEKAKRSKTVGRYVLLVRRIYSEKMVYERTIVVVRGPVLRNALRNIFRGAEGFTLTDEEHAEVEL